VLSSLSCDMIQRVPTATEAIRKIGSTDPAALLYDAMEAFEEGDPKSDEIIRSIGATSLLAPAVESCISAAASEFDVTRQQSFLRAASYGKSFCSNMDPSLFVETARKLRVMNSVRHPDIGILKYPAYEEIITIEFNVTIVPPKKMG
jgi:vacuolar protein sorting-associated protein 16